MSFYLGPNTYDLGGSHPFVTSLGNGYILAQRFHEDDGFDATVVVLSVGEDGTLTEVVKQVDPIVDVKGTHPRNLGIAQSGLYHAVGWYFNVTGSPNNALWGYRFDPSGPTLTQVPASDFPDELFLPGEEAETYTWGGYSEETDRGLASWGRAGSALSTLGWRGLVLRFGSADAEPVIENAVTLDGIDPNLLVVGAQADDFLAPLQRNPSGGWWLAMKTSGTPAEFRLYELDADLNPTGDYTVSPMNSQTGGGFPDYFVHRTHPGALYTVYYNATPPRVYKSVVPDGAVEEIILPQPVDTFPYIIVFPTVDNLWYSAAGPNLGDHSLFDLDGTVIEPFIVAGQDNDDGWIYGDSMQRAVVLRGGKRWYALTPEIYPASGGENQYIRMVGEDHVIPPVIGPGRRRGRFVFS